MKKNISVTVKGKLSDEALENYYTQLWQALKDQYGDEILAELYNAMSEK